MPVDTGEYGIRCLLLIEGTELERTSYSVFITGNFQILIQRGLCYVITLFIGCTFDIGNLQRTGVRLMIPSQEEVSTVLDDRPAQCRSILISREAGITIITANIIRT